MGRLTSESTVSCGTKSYEYNELNVRKKIINARGQIRRIFYDSMGRITCYTSPEGYGKVIRYEYDAVGNLPKTIYPDNTAVTYAYDANHNLIRVTDWANRVTSYTYGVNNRVVGVTKPDGSVTTTIYDNKQRVTSAVEKTAGGVVRSLRT
ncbi:rHS repeat-associated core domain protein [Ruminococcus sp. CAG:382]|nr:rHS repeat-associated core domain protein [Ruminococcus sp. CAG:382]